MVSDDSIHVDLRSLGRYTNRSQAPSYTQQRVNQQIDHLHQQTLSVLKCVDMKGRRPVRHSLQGDSMAKWHRGLVLKKERSHPTRGPVYRTPLTSWNGGHWNRRMPQRQEQAVRKIICHVHMATTQPSSQDITPAIFRAALMSPTRFRSTLPKHSTFSVIWDSGASMSITHDKRDFVGPLKSPGLKTKLQGIAKGLRIEGHGHVMWAMHDSEGMLRLIKLPAYYVPKSKVRLLSTTSLLQTYHSEKLTGQADRLVLSGMKGDPTKGAVTAKVNPLNNLPTSLAYRYDDLSTAHDALTTIISTVDDSN